MSIEIKASTREVPTPALNQVRDSGKIPAELYGHKVKNQHIFVDLKNLKDVYKKAGSASLIDLIIDENTPTKVIIAELQRDPLTDEMIHVDFHQVKMDEVIHAKIPLVFVGESLAVKFMGGTLIKSLNELEISCLPADLINEVKVNLDSLKTFDDVIFIKDLDIPKNIELKASPEMVVATTKSKMIMKVEDKPEAVVAEVKEGEEKAEVKEGEDQSKTNKPEKK